MNIVRKIFKVILFTFLIFLIFLIGGITYYFIVNAGLKLDSKKLSVNSTVYEFYDKNGELFYKQNENNVSDYVKLEKLNDYTINAFISIEDKRFYSHNGVDYKRMVGAFLNNVKSMKLKEGASTISQQLIKNTHLSNEKTLKRKLNEIYLTFQLEKEYSKNEILEIYLNTIYFGGGAYGINNASKRYFNKNAENLTINESATLAGLIKAPNLYSPILNYENSFKRKNLVLKTMYDNGYVNLNVYNKLLKENIKIYKNNTESYYEPYVKAVNTELENNVYINPYNNGVVKIYTYLDKSVQKHVYDISIENLNNCSREQIVKNNKNNGIIAYFGENSNLERSPASCIKPWYIYAPFINEKLITESTVIIDELTNFDGYTPKNYSNKYYGAVTVKTALSKSLNVPAVKLLSNYGFDKPNEYAKKLNVNVNGNNLAVALGATDNGITLSNLTDCYTVFANEGNYSKSSFIDKILINSKTIYNRNLNNVNVFSNETSFIISDILNDCVKNGTAKKLYDNNYKVYAKTGTNGNDNGNLDAYTICYTSEHTIGVWLGNYDNSLIKNEISGGTYPAIFAKNTLDYLYNKSTPLDIPTPKNLILANVDVNTLINEQVTYLADDNGEKFYYIKGTEPTEHLINENPTISNVKIRVDNSKINLFYDYSNANKFKIELLNYKNETISFTTNLNKYEIDGLTDGIYVISITPILIKNNNEILGETVTLPSIKISINDKILVEDWWSE